MLVDNNINKDKKQILIKKISKTILKDHFFTEDWHDRLTNLKKIYIGDATIDRVVLEAGIINYFKKKSILELEKYYADISIRAKQDLHIVDKILTFKPLLMSGIRLLMDHLKVVLHEMQLSTNITISLSKKEDQASKYSKWFSKFGDAGRELYRKALKAQYTEAQKLDVLLNKANREGWCAKKNSQELLEFAEKKVFGNFKIRGLVDPNGIVKKIKNNLVVAKQQANLLKKQRNYKQYNKNYRGIRTIGENIKKLAATISSQKIKLIASITKFSAEDNRKIYTNMQYNRIKLLHLLLKIEELAKGEFFSAKAKNQGVDFIDYFHKQMNQFKNVDSYGLILPNLDVNNNQQQLKSRLIRFTNNSGKFTDVDQFDITTEAIQQQQFEEIAKALQKQKLINNF